MWECMENMWSGCKGWILWITQHLDWAPKISTDELNGRGAGGVQVNLGLGKGSTPLSPWTPMHIEIIKSFIFAITMTMFLSFLCGMAVFCPQTLPRVINQDKPGAEADLCPCPSFRSMFCFYRDCTNQAGSQYPAPGAEFTVPGAG